MKSNAKDEYGVELLAQITTDGICFASDLPLKLGEP